MWATIYQVLKHGGPPKELLRAPTGQGSDAVSPEDLQPTSKCLEHHLALFAFSCKVQAKAGVQGLVMPLTEAATLQTLPEL